MTGSTRAALAARHATATIPIVTLAAADPVTEGLIASLARPGGNVTGMSIITPQLAAKRLELLKDTVPGLARVAVLWNPADVSTRLSLEERRARRGRWE